MCLSVLLLFTLLLLPLVDHQQDPRPPQYEPGPARGFFLVTGSF